VTLYVIFPVSSYLINGKTVCFVISFALEDFKSSKLVEEKNNVNLLHDIIISLVSEKCPCSQL